VCEHNKRRKLSGGEARVQVKMGFHLDVIKRDNFLDDRKFQLSEKSRHIREEDSFFGSYVGHLQLESFGTLSGKLNQKQKKNSIGAVIPY
jgi:hypothetical protein